MLKACTKIIVGKKTFKKGDVVNGLSKIDKERMIKDGYLINDRPEEVSAEGDTKTKGKKETAAERGGKADEF